MRGATKGADPIHQIAAISAFNSNIVLDHLDIDDVPFPIFARFGSTTLTNSTIRANATSDYINVKNGSAHTQHNVFIGNNAPDTDAIDYDGVINGHIG